MRIPKIFEPICDYFFLKVVNEINWKWLKRRLKGVDYNLTLEDKLAAEKLIAESDYLICLSRRDAYFTTLLIGAASRILSRKKTYYTHALMFELGTAMEATAKGTHLSPPSHILECDGIVFLRPKGMTHEFWEMMLVEARRNLGKPYDSIFDFTNDNEISCIEYVYDSLASIPGHRSKWPNFMGLVEQKGGVTPQMLYDSGDFDIVLEIRR